MMTINLPYHDIIFTLEAQTHVHMGAQAGSQLRGTLWYALEKFACTNPNARGNPQHTQHCPMCYLLELKQKSPRGQNPPRPFLLRPPLAVRAEDDRAFVTGDAFEVGMILLDSARHLFPFIVKGMQLAGQQGVGYGRGRFSIQRIDANHPLSETNTLFTGDNHVAMPNAPITSDDIDNLSQQLPDDNLRLRFLTPTTLKHKGDILHRPNFAAIIARLLERLQALTYHYSDQSAAPEQWQPYYESLTQLAENVQPVRDDTRWVNVRAGSRRSNQVRNIGGFVGEALFNGDMRPFHIPLLWGMGLQVGKSTVKGNGWYDIASL